jgi:L-ascorbate oxidase
MNFPGVSARKRTWYRIAWVGLIALVAACGDETILPEAGGAPTPAANELREPPTISSSGGALDLLVIAKAATITQFSPYRPIGMVYEICRRPSDGSEQCPAAGANDNEYGGTRLQLSPGDVLRVHLVNRLPTNPALFMGDSVDEFLQLSPTNLHLHGMLVSPRYATADDATWGDNVFVYNFNSANGAPLLGSNIHGSVVFDAVDYRIPIPANHPSGLYWFHPHIHGISQDQITAGLSGILTVGQIGDYACAGTTCRAANETVPPVRHLILKDTQVLANGTIQYQLRSDFCGGQALGSTEIAAGQGSCAGVDRSGAGDADYTGGRWYFTINGQQYPSVTISAPAGQVLRIVNASASATYDLNLWNALEHRQMLMQVISIDGVSIDVGAGGQASAIEQTASRFGSATCGPSAAASTGVCTTLLHLMPSSRAEVWVTYRDASGVVMAPPAGAGAILRSNGYQAGPNGDTWPPIDLAKVWYVAGAPSSVIAIRGQAASLADSKKLSGDLQSANADVPADSTCGSLPSGHKRRIFFNSPAPGANPPGSPHLGFLGLGYEEVDENDNPVPATFVDVTPFDPTAPTVCLPLAPGNLPATERWELVNLSGSDHNFHMHQAHFSVLTAADVNGTGLPGTLQGRAVMMDSLPLIHADGYCATVADWRNGLCVAHAATVQITFPVAGDFVYHCHILSHEDGGMMAVIRVRSDPASARPYLPTRILSALGFETGPRQPAARRIAGVMCRTPKTALAAPLEAH